MCPLPWFALKQGPRKQHSSGKHFISYDLVSKDGKSILGKVMSMAVLEAESASPSTYDLQQHQSLNVKLGHPHACY